MAGAARTLLIVDDSSEDRELYRRYLLRDRDHTYTILEATLGQQGLDLWHQHRPDAVLLDYRLPDIDGLEFLSRLQPSTPEFCLPVIVVTGQGNEAIAVQAIKAGAQDYLVKEQITPEGLQLAVNGVVEVVKFRAQLQHRIEREYVVTQITQRIHQSLNLDEILQATVTQVRQFLHTDRVLIVRREADGNGTVVAESVGAEWQSLLSCIMHDPYLAENHLRFSHPESISHDPAFVEDCIKRYCQGQVTAIGDIGAGTIDPCPVELLAAFQVKANLVVPILHDDQSWGWLIAHHCATPRSWQPLEIDLLKELATQVSIALRQAELSQQTQNELAERKRVEAELRESEQRYAALAEISPVGIFRTGVQGDCQYTNARWCELAGLTPEAALGTGWVSAIHPDDRDRVFADWYRAAELNLPFSTEYRFRTPEGVVSWLMGQAIAEKDIEGNVIGYVGTITDFTDRKRAEQTLQASEERLRLALEASRMGTWDWNIQAGEISWSDNLEALFGLQPGEFNGSYEMFMARLHPDDRDRVQAAIHQAVATGEDYNIEFRVVYPNGTIRWTLTLGRVLYDQNGQPLRMAGVDMDITERKRSEAALQESEERFRQLAENINTVFWLKEVPENRVSYVSPAYERLWGWNPQELYTNQYAWIDRIHPDDRDATDRAFREQAAAGQFDQEYRIVLDDGSIRWVRDRCFPLQDQSGTIYRFAGIAEDITNRKQTEAVLRQSEERYRTLFESMTEGFCVIEMLFDQPNTPVDYRFLEVNPRFEQQTGLEQAVGKTARQILPDLEPQWFERYANVALTGEPVRFEQGSEVMHRWFEVSAFRVGSPESRKVAILFKDITDRKQAEQERDRLLQQEQVARTEAERANRIKDEFLAVLSHELRSPLNPILGWTKLLQTRNLDATKTVQALTTIERNVKLQTQLIDDLLDMAKVLRGKLSIEVTSVNLVPVIESAIDTVRTAAISKSIRLHPRLPIIGQVAGDATRLQQIVWNLLSNAIKFTPQGGTVDIYLEQVNDQARILVKDTGKGISPEFLPYIFESFRQEDFSITRKYGGLGLGLAIVRQLVEAHGGTIKADSPGEGLGATFMVQLPLLSLEPASQPVNELPPPSLDLTGIRILAVDDEPDARDLLTVLLSQYGANVLIVTTAADVLANLKPFHPDVLVSDIGMPNVDGYTLIQQIRALPSSQGGQIPAIALTAYARDEDTQKAIASGYQRHVAKPLDPERLVQAVIALTQSAAQVSADRPEFSNVSSNSD